MSVSGEAALAAAMNTASRMSFTITTEGDDFSGSYFIPEKADLDTLRKRLEEFLGDVGSLKPGEHVGIKVKRLS